MGLETAPQHSLGRIDPSSIVAKADPTINPSAIEQLSHSVRQGFITAEDIKARIQANPAITEQQKLAAMIAKEGQSPEAQSVRTGATHLAGSDIEAKEAQIKYGPAIQYFQQFAPEAGIPAPVTDAGKPDYAKMAELGSQLYNWKIQKQTAVDRLTPVEWKEGLQNGQKVLLKFNKSGELISPELEQELHKRAITPFAGVQPGAVQAAPVQQSAPVVQPVTPTFSGPANTQQEAISRDQQLSKLLPNSVQPKVAAVPAASAPTIQPVQSAPSIQPVGTKIPGVGISLGANLTEEENQRKESAGVANNLAVNDQLKQNVLSAKKLLSQANIVGPGAGSAVVQTLNQVGAALGIREKEYTSQQELMQLINKKVLEGAQSMKGNLSDKDVRFLQQSFPGLTSDESTWNKYLTQWDKMLDLNSQVLRGVSPKGASIFDQANATARPGVAAPAPAAAPQGQMGPVINLPGRGPVQRGPDGQYYPAQ